MDPATGREFSFTNPQDDPQLYPPIPDGFTYDLDGTVRAIPQAPRLSDTRTVYEEPIFKGPNIEITGNYIMYARKLYSPAKHK